MREGTMAIPNVSQLTSQMALMQDDALRNYAAMHQSDPYILALAVSEKNRRAALRQGQLAGPQGPQPTVAEQEIASMGTQPAPTAGAPMGGLGGLMGHQAAPQPQMPAPQQTAPQPQQPPAAGLSALPAPNMEGMEPQGLAGGGLMGYSGGGVTEEEDTRTPWEQRHDGSEWLQRRPLTELLKRIGGSMKENPALTSERERMDRRLSTKGDKPDTSRPTDGLRAIENRDRAAEKVPMPDAPAAPAGLGALAQKADVESLSARTLPTARPKAQPVEEAPETLDVEPVTSEADLLSDYEKRMREMGEEQLKGMEGLQSDEKAAREAELKEFDERAAKEPMTGEKKRERLDAERGTLDKSEKVAMGNAALRGMLAVLAGTNPRRSVNMARGAAVALNSFERQKDKIDQRREQINAGLDRIEELREAAKAATGKERQALVREMRGEESARKREMFSMQKLLGWDVKKNVIDTGLQLALEQRKEARANQFDLEKLDKTQAFTARENALNRGNTLAVAGMRGGGADGNVGQQRMALVEMGKQAQEVLKNAVLNPDMDPAVLQKAQQTLDAVQVELAKMAGISATSAGSGAPSAFKPTGNPLVDKYLVAP